MKGDTDNEKNKAGIEKKLKLTVSRALSDQIETKKKFSISQRARQKELKNSNKEENKEN